MHNHRSPLHNLRVANPCPASWKDMVGDDRVRHCAGCQMNVYNISELSTAEAEELLRTREGRLCIRYYQRLDGLILTRDCPNGMMAARTKLARGLALSAGLIVCVLGFIVQDANAGARGPNWVEDVVGRGRSVPVIGTLIDRIAPRATMGESAPPPP